MKRIKGITLQQAIDRIKKEIQFGKYPVIMAPLFGAMVPVIVRELTSAQIKSCGSFSLIYTIEDKLREKSGKYTRREIVQYAEQHKAILKAALVCPTYEQLIEGLQVKENMADLEQQIKQIDDLIRQCPRGPQRQKFEEERDGLRIWVDLILPDNFVSVIVAHALGVNKSDIQKVSEEMLIEAAYLAERGHDNPCDHLTGNFTEFMKDDINVRAWYLYDERKKEFTGAAS